MSRSFNGYQRLRCSCHASSTPRCGCGFTPGFWKHNLRVYMGETNGKYSAFSWDGKWSYYFTAGTKLDDGIMKDLIGDVIAGIYLKNGYVYTQEDLLAFLDEKGWSSNRTNTANWFNYVAGYGPF